MKGVRAVFRKEFRSYLQSSMGYIYLVVFLVLRGFRASIRPSLKTNRISPQVL